MRDNKWIAPLLLAAVALIFVLSLVLAPAPPEGVEAFEGTDGLVTESLEEDGAEPWFTPLFEPSGEVESGLFALQAAIGAGILGYAMGTLRGRKRAREELASPLEPSQ